MGKRTKQLKVSQQASTACIAAMINTVTEAGALVATVSAHMEAGDDVRAFDAVLDVEPLLYEAGHLLQAASILRRAGRS
jgi:hypothetical protein